MLFSDETFDELRTRILLPKFDRYAPSRPEAPTVRQDGTTPAGWSWTAQAL